MKRAMTTVLAVGLAGGLGLASVALAQDYTLYGSVRAGLIGTDPETGGSTWDIGAQDSTGDRLWSRIGVRASYDLGNGMSSGLHIERRLDNLRVRHQNVWLGWEGAGRLTFGQQSSAYDSTISWDGSYFLGGKFKNGPGRQTGIKFASDLGGPFNVQVMALDDNSNDNGSGDGLDAYQVAASMALGDVATLSAAYSDVDGDTGSDHMGLAVKGSMAGLSWMAGYENGDSNDNDKANDTDSFGVHVGYTMGNGGTLYGQYASLGLDKKKGLGGGDRDGNSLLLGYSHSLGTNTTFIAEYRMDDVKNDRGNDADVNVTALALKVDF